MAGKKGVVVSTSEGTKERHFCYCLIAGIERAPLHVTKRMCATKVEKRMRPKTFIRYVNVRHLMPTRYTVSNDFDIKALVPEGALDNSAARKKARKDLAGIFYEKFMNPVNEKAGKVSKDVLFLRKKLRF
ncbi:ribosomal protein [Cyclospora cayetanensis]|nr:ribosomal protein [Cyclospora cayetanensis]